MHSDAVRSPPLHQLLRPPYVPSSAPLLHRFASSAYPIWQRWGDDYTQHTSVQRILHGTLTSESRPFNL